MKAIVTKRNADGSYDSVGMKNRTIITDTRDNILRRAKQFAGETQYRVELFISNHTYGTPAQVLLFEDQQLS